MARRETEAQVLTELGRRVQRERLRVGYSQEHAAARAEVDAKRWQRIEGGKVNPTIRTLWRIARALGVSLWKLLGEEPRA